ncbi:MAG: hypothetical protein MJ161_02315 [Clostridia bacterium]|nr:hypothetical protein [Clostridia bacterium]
MSTFDELGVMVDGLEDDSAEEYGGEVEEIFRFDVFITEEKEIEIGVNIAEIEIEEHPDFGEEYSLLARTFADLIVEHVGINTEILMSSVEEMPEQDVSLSLEEQQILMDRGTGENGSVLFYSFPVLIMEDDETGEKQLGAGFNRSQKADVLLKVYGEEFAAVEEVYQEKITDAVLDHGMLFIKAVESIKKL